jgi:hypothetical protein
MVGTETKISCSPGTTNQIKEMKEDTINWVL